MYNVNNLFTMPRVLLMMLFTILFQRIVTCKFCYVIVTLHSYNVKIMIWHCFLHCSLSLFIVIVNIQYCNNIVCGLVLRCEWLWNIIAGPCSSLKSNKDSFAVKLQIFLHLTLGNVPPFEEENESEKYKCKYMFVYIKLIRFQYVFHYIMVCHDIRNLWWN